jgi:hypothetical protein
MPQQLAQDRLPTHRRTRCARLHVMIPGDTFNSDLSPFTSSDAGYGMNLSQVATAPDQHLSLLSLREKLGLSRRGPSRPRSSK